MAPARCGTCGTSLEFVPYTLDVSGFAKCEVCSNRGTGDGALYARGVGSIARTSPRLFIYMVLLIGVAVLGLVAGLLRLIL